VAVGEDMHGIEVAGRRRRGHTESDIGTEPALAALLSNVKFSLILDGLLR
jgi:hypothetical protein